MEWSPDARFILAHAPGCKGSLVIVPVADPGLGVRALDLPERMRESITWQRVIP
jgi:hypothetical protein